ncbi:MAG: isoprenylcysteine carboxylmethyltransferase family protein [Bryobacteraceae bacterium]|jgi:protein-S-isoprenylcysteine O-methyltransferase Ste14
MTEAKPQHKLAAALLRVPVPWVFVLTYLIGAGLEAIFHLGKFLNYEFLTPIGFVIFVLGCALAAWGWLIFQSKGTTRVPGEASVALVTWGPYEFTRNPMYVGLSVAYIGEACILHQAIPVILLPLTIAYLNQVVIPLEEGRLRGVFGTEYERYTERVRRWV